MAMAWLAQAKGKGRGATDTPTGASGKGSKLAITNGGEKKDKSLKKLDNLQENESTGDAAKTPSPLASSRKKKDTPENQHAKEPEEPVGKKKNRDKTKDDGSTSTKTPKSEGEVEETAGKRKKKDKRQDDAEGPAKEGGDEPASKRKKKDKRQDDAEGPNEGEDEPASKRKKKDKTQDDGEGSTDKRVAADKSPDQPAKLRKKKSTVEEASAEVEEPTKSKKQKQQEKKEKAEKARALAGPCPWEDCSDTGESVADLSLKRASKSEHNSKQCKKMEAQVGYPFVRLRTKTSEESLGQHVTPNRPTKKPSSPAPSSTSSGTPASKLNAQQLCFCIGMHCQQNTSGSHHHSCCS